MLDRKNLPGSLGEYRTEVIRCLLKTHLEGWWCKMSNWPRLSPHASELQVNRIVTPASQGC